MKTKFQILLIFFTLEPHLLAFTLTVCFIISISYLEYIEDKIIFLFLMLIYDIFIFEYNLYCVVTNLVRNLCRSRIYLQCPNRNMIHLRNVANLYTHQLFYRSNGHFFLVKNNKCQYGNTIFRFFTQITCIRILTGNNSIITINP